MGRPHMYGNFEDWFEPVTESGCWLWKGPVNLPYGHGRFMPKLDQVKVLAHRFAYERYIGPIPPGMFVCHHCDVPSCVNPKHLFVGTHADNMRDMVKKGRGARGERSGKAKLTAEQVLEIRRTQYSRRIRVNLAIKYGVSQYTIGDLRRNRNWKHLL